MAKLDLALYKFRQKRTSSFLTDQLVDGGNHVNRKGGMGSWA